MDGREDLKWLIKRKFGSIKAFAESMGLSENTVHTHLKDGNWDVKQIVKIVVLLGIPKKMIYVYFFETELALIANETA